MIHYKIYSLLWDITKIADIPPVVKAFQQS